MSADESAVDILRRRRTPTLLPFMDVAQLDDASAWWITTMRAEHALRYLANYCARRDVTVIDIVPGVADYCRIHESDVHRWIIQRWSA